ncbi:histidine kinase [Pedobacter sp. PAMC26386]|nr:histidine kinase [Pedobacter sp. PAMC26386]
MGSDLFTLFNKYKYHFLGWGAFISYEIIMGIVMVTKEVSLVTIFFATILNVSLFYLHANVVLKYTLNAKKKLFKFSLLFFILLEVLLFIYLKRVLLDFIYAYLTTKPAPTKFIDPLSFFALLWRTIFFIGNSTGYYFLVHDQEQRQQVKKLRQQQLKKIIREKEVNNELIQTQNDFLRSQINPHFLINTLSYLYNETRKLAPKAAESILSLTDIMQYALSKEAPDGYVKFEGEIDLVERFLSLSKISQPDQVQLKLSYNLNVLSVPFIPLVLMPLTESIIKYGQLNDPMKPAGIRITYENSILAIETSNHEFIGEQSSINDPMLKIIQNRLLLAYGERAVFNFHLDSENYFHTNTQVQF